MDCPSCGEEMRDGWLMLTVAEPFTELVWSPERAEWGPKLLFRETHAVIGMGFGGRPREANRCGNCTTVVVPPEW